jgi:toxin-antitoxin system PIN domain toxin
MATEPTYLLDVNVLMALAWPQHVHHGNAQSWFNAVRRRRFATCSLTETAFLRLSTNPKVVGTQVRPPDVLELLRGIRGMPGHRFVADDSSLAEPVISLERLAVSSQVTDVHLINLAALSSTVLATLDRAITTYLRPDEADHVRLLR